MGIFIYLSVSNAVTKEEWASVYQESLKLVRHLPFAERRKVSIHGIDTRCLVRTQEHEYYDDWNNEETSGWFTDGDYDTMRTAECYRLLRDLVKDRDFDPDAGDAMISQLSQCLGSSWDDKEHRNSYELWHSKTQGEPYHMYILAVGCLIEARLGHKAYVHGDITRGQCKKAVEIANEYLDEPIEMPDRCYADRLLNRISELPLSEQEKLEVFESSYLGTKDREFGKMMRQVFSEDMLDAYWAERFSRFDVGLLGFDGYFSEYMLLGFDLEKLCGYVKLENEKGEDQSRAFVTKVMDAKLHLENKNCKDYLKIDQEEERPYSIGTLFAQFAFAGAENKKVDRYIPIEEIRAALKAGLKNRCDVDAIIDEYLEKEAEQTAAQSEDVASSKEKSQEAVQQDTSEAFTQFTDKAFDAFQKAQEEYDIIDYANLKYYEDGDKLYPTLEKSIGKSRAFLDDILNEDEYVQLLSGDAHTRCQWLAEQNRYFMIRDSDWSKIYSDIENNKDAFGRYYPLFRVRQDSDELIDMSVALLINDALYEYSSILAAQIGEGD